MKIAVTGGTGFIGRPLVDALVRGGHEVTVLTRTPETARGFPAGVRLERFDLEEPLPPERLRGAEAVVDLAGENVGERRWTAEVKRRVLESRTQSTARVIEAARVGGTVRTLLLASGVGYYGDRGEVTLTEESAPGDDFLSMVCQEREKVGATAEAAGIRVVPLRIGIVLHASGGALERLLLPFKLGVGGPFGSGAQYFPWIHLDDAVRMMTWAIVQPEVRGPLNVTGPEPVTNGEFAKALGRALRRPAFLKAPAFALKLVLGELAAGVLGGQRALPRKAETLGFEFRFRNVDAALADLL